MKCQAVHTMQDIYLITLFDCILNFLVQEKIHFLYTLENVVGHKTILSCSKAEEWMGWGPVAG